jgi:hypothetical protein
MACAANSMTKIIRAFEAAPDRALYQGRLGAPHLAFEIRETTFVSSVLVSGHGFSRAALEVSF